MWWLAIGMAISAIGALSNAQSQENAAEYNKQVAERDAAIAIDQGNAQAAIQGRQSRSVIDAARAQYGASGVDVNSGSPLDVLRSSASFAALDNLTIKYNAKVRSQGFKGEALGYEMQGDAAKTRGYWAGADILMGRGAQIYDAWQPTGAGSAIPTGEPNKILM